MKRLLLYLFLAAALSGCSVTRVIEQVGRELGSTIAAPVAEKEDGRLDTIAFAGAYCRNDREAALAAARELVAANPDHPKAQLALGIGLHVAGEGTEAYRVLERLSAGGHRMTVALKCGSDFVYSGSVSEVAQRRLFDVRTQLQALGARLPLPDAKAAQEGEDAIYRLAAAAPARSLFAEAPVRSEPAAKMATAPGGEQKAANTPPARTGPGGLFVHLGSYRSMKTLDRGWKSLQARFRDTLGDQEKAVRKVDLGRKGRYLRLGVSTASKASASRLCRQFRSRGQYCAVLGPGRS